MGGPGLPEGVEALQQRAAAHIDNAKGDEGMRSYEFDLILSGLDLEDVALLDAFDERVGDISAAEDAPVRVPVGVRAAGPGRVSPTGLRIGSGGAMAMVRSIGMA